MVARMQTYELRARYDGAVSPIRKRDPRLSRAFGRALKIARVRADQSREELAGAAGLGRADEVGRFERGEREPTLSVFMALARALGVSTASLLAATEEELHDVRPARRHAGSEAEAAAKPRPPVAMAVIVQHGLVLMTRRVIPENLPGKGPTILWSFPSGELEGNETPEEAVVRETMEELSLKVRPVARLGQQVHPLSPDKRLFIYVACEIIGGTLELKDHEELAKLRWCSLPEAMERVERIGGFYEPVQAYLAGVLVGERT
jgi:8-oxo-dGTP pyrophosphatase MutT (NUDIX family)/DNA-binding XRE family transcriptional regulator